MHKEPEFADFIGAGLFPVDDLVDDITLPMLRYAYVRIQVSETCSVHCFSCIEYM